MAIKASSSKQIDALIADLDASSAVARETAVARLAVLGARAVERLIGAAAASGRPADARAAAWRALESIGDSRALEPALASLAQADLSPLIGVAAAGVARVHLRGPHGADAVDRLATVLLDRMQHEDVRLASLRALRDLAPAAIAPILAALADDPNAIIRTEAALTRRGASGGLDDPAALLTRAAESGLADDAGALRHALSRAAATAPLPVLLRIVERVREREGAEKAAERAEWRQARAAAHLALANRGSRLALYDLRESLEAATAPLPVEFLAALALIGDTSCVESIAAAHAKTKDAWWRHHLADAFYTIVKREKLTSRNAVMKRIAKRSPGLVAKPGV